MSGVLSCASGGGAKYARVCICAPNIWATHKRRLYIVLSCFTGTTNRDFSSNFAAKSPQESENKKPPPTRFKLPFPSLQGLHATTELPWPYCCGRKNIVLFHTNLTSNSKQIQTEIKIGAHQ